MKRGFTLIELLVVVLIIGILAAIALPQYQKAVEKSRAMQGITLLKNVGNAAEVYYLEHGIYPTSFSQLDIEIPWTGNEQAIRNQIRDTRSNGEWSLQIRTLLTGPVAYYDIILGRLTGPYAGTGFIYSAYSWRNFPRRTVLCLEQNKDTTVGIPFTKNPGDYCQKIWKGKSPIGATFYRAYPFL